MDGHRRRYLEAGRARYGADFTIDGRQDLTYASPHGEKVFTYWLPGTASEQYPYQGCGEGVPGHGWTAGRVQRARGFLAEGTGNTPFAQSPHWERGVFVVVCDEWGGFLDHVRPGTAIDSRSNKIEEQNFGQLGFRVPAIVAAPFAQQGFVDHTIYDHTSILRMLEWRFLGAPAEGPRSGAGGHWTLTLLGRVQNDPVALTELERIVPAKPGRPEIGGPDHPMRAVTRQVAFDPSGWTPERAAKVAELFDSLASTWSGRDIPERHDALRDALTRGGPFSRGVCLEVGAGTGSATRELRTAFAEVVSTDLSREMLDHFVGDGVRVQADAASLPVRARSVAVVALVNMFVFPYEIDRVLARDGVVLWVSTNGDATPIYLSPADVLAALPGDWEGVTAEAGWGIWLTARRAGGSSRATLT